LATLEAKGGNAHGLDQDHFVLHFVAQFVVPGVAKPWRIAFSAISAACPGGKATTPTTK